MRLSDFGECRGSVNCSGMSLSRAQLYANSLCDHNKTVAYQAKSKSLTVSSTLTSSNAPLTLDNADGDIQVAIYRGASFLSTCFISIFFWTLCQLLCDNLQAIA